VALAAGTCLGYQYYIAILQQDKEGLKRETQRRKDDVEDSIAFRIFLGTLSV
jgi:hypothetical protein